MVSEELRRVWIVCEYTTYLPTYLRTTMNTQIIIGTNDEVPPIRYQTNTTNRLCILKARVLHWHRRGKLRAAGNVSYVCAKACTVRNITWSTHGL